MNSLARALLGVALGSCLTLFAHPVSRPYMLGLIPRTKEAEAISQVSGEGSGPIDFPASTAEAALWMQLGAARLAAGKKLTDEELESLVALAKHTQKAGTPSQFNNAFWPQMEAVFLDQMGKKAEAKKAWIEATKCSLWRDYQAARLLDEAYRASSVQRDEATVRLADSEGTSPPPLAWHFAGLYYQRRFAVGAALQDFAKRTMSTTGKTSSADVGMRYATLMNAKRIAEGAQSVEILKYAGAIADIAVSDLAKQTNPRISGLALRPIARGIFYDALVQLGYKDQADEAKAAYDNLDSQPALTRPFRPTETAAQISGLSIVTATLPDSLLIIALLGAIFWPIGHLILRYSQDRNAIGWPTALAFGGVLAIGAIWLSLPIMAALVALLCALFLTYTPKNERSRLPSDLGAAFNWTVGLLAVFFMVACAACLAAFSTPAKLLLPSMLEASPESIGNRFEIVLIGLSAIIFALLLLLAPMWSFARKVRTPFVLGLAFRVFGIVLVTVGLAGTVLVSPLCVYADSRARRTLAEIVGNEPVHYYQQFQ